MHLDLDVGRVEDRVALERLLYLLLYLDGLDGRLHDDVVGNAFDSLQVIHAALSGCLLVTPRRLAAESYPAVMDDGSDRRHACHNVPAKRVRSGLSDFRVRAHARNRKLDLNFIGYRAYSFDSFRDILCGPSTRIVRGLTGERHDAVMDNDTNLLVIHARIPLQFGFHVASNLRV